MSRTPTDPAERRLVDRFLLAAVLGVSPARVKALHDEGRIIAYAIGARLRFDVAEVLAALRVPSRATEREDGAA